MWSTCYQVQVSTEYIATVFDLIKAAIWSGSNSNVFCQSANSLLGSKKAKIKTETAKKDKKKKANVNLWKD